MRGKGGVGKSRKPEDNVRLRIMSKNASPQLNKVLDDELEDYLNVQLTSAEEIWQIGGRLRREGERELRQLRERRTRARIKRAIQTKDFSNLDPALVTSYKHGRGRESGERRPRDNSHTINRRLDELSHTVDLILRICSRPSFRSEMREMREMTVRQATEIAMDRLLPPDEDRDFWRRKLYSRTSNARRDRTRRDTI